MFLISMNMVNEVKLWKTSILYLTSNNLCFKWGDIRSIEMSIVVTYSHSWHEQEQSYNNKMVQMPVWQSPHSMGVQYLHTFIRLSGYAKVNWLLVAVFESLNWGTLRKKEKNFLPKHTHIFFVIIFQCNYFVSHIIHDF